ncbi:GAF domain-containing protein [Oculatella sp. LEGE 06141]|uniref:ATP-binding protein n=1 Tax=Oculatella sp. LEGE 06141 TaxID=1828648 RepID=UPI00187E6CDA|nr:ATP-binding protein [Oculatella sp. LEGE 06141]MBE9178175.1 GAF domain-containing protein [Oculatella sp. LEGE 06141]
MTSSGDFSLSLTESIDLAATKTYDGFLPTSQADLVFTQDRTGDYQSFYWRDAKRHGVEPEHLVEGRVGAAFAPVAIDSYLNRVCRILDYVEPERFNYPFHCDSDYLVFDLVISPVLVPNSAATTVIVTGQFLYAASRDQALELVNQLGHTPCLTNHDSKRYRKLLNQVAWNIRRTLDLDTIWQQTVDGLGEALDVSRCLICPYPPSATELEVVAEYCHASLSSMLGTTLSLDQDSYLSQALATHKPIALTSVEANLANQPYSILAVATCYQDQPNGLIVLHQFDRSRVWNDLEINLIRELADQVGTGIAHATLFAESQNLAAEFGRLNDSLMQQHQDLEDARQQAEEASRRKSEFLANTSHELRTPLNGMIGFLKLIIDGMADDPAEQMEFIQEAHNSAVHLLSLINDILDIAKIESGKMQLDFTQVKLDDLLTAVENFTRTQAQQKGLSFEIRTPVTRDEVVLYGNYQRLLQVMLNLVGNAIKFTHEGGITITAEVIQKSAVIHDHDEENLGMAKISVADTGIGVSLEKQDKLFQSFSQLDGSRTRQYGGTGLGLAISQKLVEAMDGVVNFYSMGEGLGSTVTFTVPLYQDPVMVVSPIQNSSDGLIYESDTQLT